MPANVESMFYVRKTPWHGLGVCVEEALCSAEAVKKSGLDWSVTQESVFTENHIFIPNYKANLRESDGKVLGVVSDRYRIVQNSEAFSFTDSLLGEGVRYETAGSLQEGRKVWLLAKLPNKYRILGDEVCPYLVFSNSHDGTGAIKVAMTPIRVVCQNTLNLALSSANRIWATNHTGDVSKKLDEARKTILMSESYMENLSLEAAKLSQTSISDLQFKAFIDQLIPLEDEASPARARNVQTLREDISMRYHEAPDLKDMPRTGWRLINAVSDFATHVEPLRRTQNYKENLFAKTIEGNPVIDKAYEILRDIA